ncbi:JmjC domain-containing protein [Cynara cardunculus var. scolymus]|uniref:JmjC domain-containing protein n=1 Tax=Cynara cardunculus var. scolymus TaxID=59895 RepID=A0A124SB53_CYNCS|nr:JmjC domain-containing protein [Cynara cardunculus var. scolymus]
MDHTRSNSGTAEDNAGIPDDLRCKRSDGKQWRCHAMSMPDKTVCEKHYIQAKRRAANSAMRASLKKAKRKSVGESDSYLESKSDDMDSPLVDFPISGSGNKHKEKLPKKQISYSPETPSFKNSSVHISSKSNDDPQRDLAESEETPRAYRTPSSVADSSKSRSDKMHGASAMTETSDGSSESSEDTGGQICHQCRRDDTERIVWCLKCDRRGYCDECIATWYPDIPVEEIHRICPVCRGSCNCKMCLRGDNMIKGKIRDIPGQEKLEHLFCLLSSVLPVVKQIHFEQCSELELERRLRGNRIDLPRTKLNADEQIDFCRIPIIDYHRHCEKCSYDICLRCCQDVRKASKDGGEAEVSRNLTDGRNEDTDPLAKQEKPLKPKMRLSNKLCDWKANTDGSVPCPPKEHGGCGNSPLMLKRIFKMNWVAKLVKNVDEMVSGCKMYDFNPPKIDGVSSTLCQSEGRENNNDNFVYAPSSQDIKSEGINEFRKHWIKGEPVIVREVCDESSMLGWDPMVMWKGIQETTDERMKDDNRAVKAIDCLDRSEIDIELGQFIRGYSEGRLREDHQPEMLVLKNWPSPSASEEFLLYQRPEFISKLPLLEYIHSKWGLLNLAAKLPHYSLQNDVGPKILISYGMHDELGQGDSVNMLRFNMRDVVYLLVHTCEVKLPGLLKTKTLQRHGSLGESEVAKSPEKAPDNLSEQMLPKSPIAEHSTKNDGEISLDSIEDDRTESQGISITTTTIPTTTDDEKTLKCEDLNRNCEETLRKSHPGAIWDIFRREDVPKLIEYMRVHWEEIGMADNIINDSVPWPLHEGVIYLNIHHKRKLKEEFGIEPWSFEQQLGVAVFIPAGCPFQVRNLQSSVQLGLDFLFPESLAEAVRLAGEIRELPNDHDAKLQMLEVGKISLYAASSSIKEVQKLVLDPKVGAELAFEDPNLTKLVSMNLEKMTKQRQVACA